MPWGNGIMIADKKSYQISLFVVVNILINCIGKIVAKELQLPLWLDSFGTVYTAYLLGPVCGAIVGASVNIIYAVLFSYTHMIYAIVSVILGITVGVCAKKGYLTSLFGTLSVSFLVTMISVLISTPLNYLFFEGNTGNIWGDGVISLLQRIGCNEIVSHCIGEFYIDFLDKTLTITVLSLTVRLYRRYGKELLKRKKPWALLAVIGILTLFSGMEVKAENAADGETVNFNAYIQTVYDGKSGLPGGSANDIAQTNDGILWIGTYGGLYRYDGNTFQLMDEFESVKNVNCLYTDEEGRLWIGTNDSGLSIYINDKISNIVDKNDGLSSDSVRCITQSTDGNYYVGTAGEVCVLTLSGGLAVKKVIPEIVYANSMAADADGTVAVVANDGILYLLKEGEIFDTQSAAEEDSYTCCLFDEAGNLYAGTASNRVDIYYMEEDGTFSQKDSRRCEGLMNLTSFYQSESGNLFLCADNGVAYFDAQGNYHTINTNEFNNSIDHMLIDYQKNLWFTSSRLGLLRLYESAFTEIYREASLEEKVVNTVTKWNNVFYFGTDSGLDVLDAQKIPETAGKLQQALEGVRIRQLMVDKENHLWICTTGQGTWEVDADGTIRKYDRMNGLNDDKTRSAMETKDGRIIVAANSGLSIIKDGKVSANIGCEEGLKNPIVLCMLEQEDGTILAGTDGGGIAVIKGKEVVKNLSKSDGLSSEVILRMIADKDGTGIFIVTSNGICFMNTDGTIQTLEKFPYYNNYDIVEGSDGMLFVCGSAGIYVVDKTELLSGREMEYKLLDSSLGFQKSLTPNAWNYVDEEENLYLSTDTGVVQMNLKHYDNAARSYRMLVRSIQVDDTVYPVERGEAVYLPSGTDRIEIITEIINYSPNMPYVSVYLEGFDKNPKVMQQNELTNVAYTNLPVGTYTFHLAVLDSRGKNVIAESTYTIIKEKEIYDNWWFMLYVVLVFGIAIAYLTWLFFRTQIQRTINMQKKELELARSQIEMGNETVLTIARTVDAKDENTSQHSFRVSEYSVMIAKQLGYGDAACEELRKTALLHDIGKIGIPDRVLNKPDKLTDEEYALMKSHVVKGAEILRKFTLVQNVQEGALYHHERYDGKGYVHGLKGEEIPLNARIIGIADAFDAMTANRVYRKKLDIDYVIGELKKGSGTQFDPKLVEIMLDLIDKGEIDVERMYEEFGSHKE